MAKQILLADDSATIGKIVQITFAHEDAVVTAVRSGDEALARARSARPDIVLLDATMPGKSGYEVCAELRSSGVDVPVLILTGNFSPYDEGKGKSAGADGNVVKPFESQSLIDRVNQLVGQKGAGAGARPSAGPPSGRVEPLAPPIGSGPVKPVAAPAAPPRPAPPPHMGAQPPKAPPKPPAQAPRATLMGIPTVNPGASPNLAGAQATFSPPQNPHEQRTVEMQAPVMPAKAPEPPRPTAMGIPTVDVSKLTPADARKAPPLSAFPNTEERTQVEVQPPAGVMAPPRPTSMGIPTVPSTPMAPPPPQRADGMDKQLPGPTAMGIPTVQPTRPNVPTPPRVESVARPVAPPAARPVAPAAMPLSPTMAAAPPAAASGSRLRPSLIPHAPTPQPRNPDNDFESDEATRKVDIAIPRQARRDPLATVPTMDVVAEAALPKVMEAAAPRIAEATAEAVARAGARGPEYEAIAKLSREVIEQVVWEVVPDLAEAIIKAELDRLVKERKSAS